MDPITHLLTGACLGRAGFNRKAAYATLAMTLAAEIPDLDTVWSVGGPVAGFLHHRGITHTFAAVPLDALAALGMVWLAHRWRVGRAAAKAAAIELPVDPMADQPIVRPLTAAPLRWGLLYGFALFASLSHIFLDWTNNYGVRPFFPVFRGRGWAIFALAVMAGLWGWRWVEHEAAVQLASTAIYGPEGSAGVEVLRVTASPYPGNPYHWHTVVEAPGFYQMADVDTLKETVATNPEQDLFYKPAATPAIRAAEASRLGKAYLDWSSWPLVSDMGPGVPDDGPADAAGWTAVRFVDLRFLYDTFLMRGREAPPISGTVYIDGGGRVAWTEFNGAMQK